MTCWSPSSATTSAVGRPSKINLWRSVHRTGGTPPVRYILTLHADHADGSDMADPRAFVSFDFDHNETQKNLFAGQAKKESPTPFTVQDWSSKSSLPQTTWETEVQRKIAATNMCIVLVGRSISSAGGVAKEVAMAKAVNVPVFGVYVDGAGATSTLPNGLQRNRTMAWDWNLIAAAVKQMMGEGKNA